MALKKRNSRKVGERIFYKIFKMAAPRLGVIVQIISDKQIRVESVGREINVNYISDIVPKPKSKLYNDKTENSIRAIPTPIGGKVK